MLTSITVPIVINSKSVDVTCTVDFEFTGGQDEIANCDPENRQPAVMPDLDIELVTAEIEWDSFNHKITPESIWWDELDDKITSDEWVYDVLLSEYLEEQEALSHEY